MGMEKSNSESFFTENLTLDADCIVCAAGFSSRMGRWKADLKTAKGLTFLDNALRAAASCRKTVLVGGYRFEELLERIPPGFGGSVLENPGFREGMLSTVQRALSAVDGFFFILPIDMPMITADHLRAVYEERDMDRVVRPSFGGLPGHPVLCPPGWRDKLLSGRGRSPSSVIGKGGQRMIPWQDDSVVLDVDTQDAYEAYLGRQL